MEYCFPPIIDENVHLLILGSLPGPRSLAAGQYYAHPQNQFWNIIFSAFDAEVADSYAEKSTFLLCHGIGLWDVLQSAEREGALDTNIKQARVNDFAALFASYPNIRWLIFNGRTAEKYFRKYFPQYYTSINNVCLLSTSPACAGNRQDKFRLWHQNLRKFTEQSCGYADGKERKTDSRLEL